MKSVLPVLVFTIAGCHAHRLHRLLDQQRYLEASELRERRLLFDEPAIGESVRSKTSVQFDLQPLDAEAASLLLQKSTNRDVPFAVVRLRARGESPVPLEFYGATLHAGTRSFASLRPESSDEDALALAAGSTPTWSPAPTGGSTNSIGEAATIILLTIPTLGILKPGVVKPVSGASTWQPGDDGDEKWFEDTAHWFAATNLQDGFDRLLIFPISTRAITSDHVRYELSLSFLVAPQQFGLRSEWVHWSVPLKPPSDAAELESMLEDFETRDDAHLRIQEWVGNHEPISDRTRL